MEKFDVIIVGAGPAGLKAAEILAKNKKKVLVLEKNKKIGPKVCAGGITDKDLEYIPKTLVEKKFNSFCMTYCNNKTMIKYTSYTIDRERLGQYQLNEAKKAGAFVKTGCYVKQIKKNSIVADKEYFYDFLIGADGSNSTVRQFLGLKSEIMGLTIQYQLKDNSKNLEFYYNPKRYGLWYAWVFPHKTHTSIGIGTLLQDKRTKNLRKILDDFANNNKFELKDAKFEAALINSSFNRFGFNNIFLAGDAAGLANPFTGEGIYQALVSGEEIAKKILNPGYECRKLNRIIAKNRKLTKLLLALHKMPMLAGFIYWAGFKLIKYKVVQKKLISVFLEY